MSKVSASEERTGSVIFSPTVQSLSASSDGSVWAVDLNGGILGTAHNSELWLPRPDSATYVAVSPEANAVVAVRGGSPYLADLTAATWRPLGSPPVAFAELELGLHEDQGSWVTDVWAVDTAGMVWTCLVTDGAWANRGVAANQVSATADGVVYRLDAGSVFQLVGSDTWQPVATPEPFVSVSAGASGWLWGVGASGGVHQYDGAEGWITVDPPPSVPRGRLSCGEDTTVWLLAGGTVYQFDPTAEGWTKVVWEGSSPVAQVAVGDREHIWAVDGTQAIWWYTANLDAWEPLAGALPALSQVAAQDRHALWGLDGSSAVVGLHEDGGSWTASPPGEVRSWVSAGADGTVWSLAAGAAFQLTAGTWTPRSSSPTLARVSVASADHVAAVGTDGQAYRWDGEASAWAVMPATNPPDALHDVAVTRGGAVWGAGENGLHLFLGQWVPVSSQQLRGIAATSVSDVWGIDSAGKAIHVSGDASALESTQTGTGLPRWDTENAYDEAESTHLWIVNRAASVASSQGPVGQRVSALVKPFAGKIGDAFHDSLLKGLYDADFEPEYNNPVVGEATYASHFWDPDRKVNWLQQESPTALSQGTYFFNQSVASFVADDWAAAGYALGLSLHYLTDLTQPMHAANFTWLHSFPRFGYHTAFEEYVLEIQAGVTAPTAYVQTVNGTDPEAYLRSAAGNAKSKYLDKICTWWAYNSYFRFTDYYRSLAEKYVPAILRDAIAIAAQYLVAWMNAVGKVVPLDGWSTWSAVAGSRLTGDPVVATNAYAGSLEAFAQGDGRRLGHAWEMTKGWSDWRSLQGPQAVGPPVVVENLDRRLEAFVIDAAGTLWHAWQANTPTGWSSWADLPGATLTGTPAVFQSGTLLEVIALDAEGGLHVASFPTSRHAWSSWAPVPGLKAIAGFCTWVSKDGLQTLVARDGQNRIWSTVQRRNGTWSAATPLAGIESIDVPVIGNAQDGSLMLFTRDERRVVQYSTQRRDHGWEPWSALPGAEAADPPTFMRSWANVPVIFARGTDDSLWHITRDQAGWTGWEALTGPTLSGPPVALYGNYHRQLHVVVPGAGGSLWSLSKSTATAPWSAWEELPKVSAASPPVLAVDVMRGHRMEVFVRSADDQLRRSHQLMT